MKARHIVLIGLAVLAAACSSSTPVATPSTSTSTTVSPASTSTTAYQGNREPPPVPHCYYTGSGYGTCEGYIIPAPGTVILLTRPDKNGIFKLTGPAPLQTKIAVACGDAGCVYNHLDWATSYGSGVSNAVDGTCKSNTTVCNVQVPPGLQTWTPVFVRQNNNPAILYLIWNSDKPGATISGYVHDKDGQGVADATVTASGAESFTSTVDPTSGFYLIEVTPGQYNVVPSGGPGEVTAPRFTPESRKFTLSAGDETEADFTFNAGIRVALTLSQQSVPADGLTVVKGEIKTTLFGKPDPNVTLTLRPQPGESSTTAVTTGTHAVVCGSYGTRIWPAGSLYAPSGAPVDVVTDANGIYDFTLAVGTVPGSFVLNASAKNSSGDLITSDIANSSPDVTLTVNAPGSTAVSQFVTELDTLKSDAAASKLLGAMQLNAADISQALAQLSGADTRLGGLAYFLVTGTSAGSSFIVYPDSAPPSVDSSGYVTAAADTLVITPSSWIGTTLIPHTALNVVMQQGQLSSVPTFAQWTQGQSVPGWSLNKNKAVAWTSAFEYDGWPYPSTETGACS
jgi:hypothetical protein